MTTPTLARLASLKTTTERAVDDLSEQLFRPKNTGELKARIDERVRRAANSHFGDRDTFLLEASYDLDKLILDARKDLGIATLTLEEHCAQLEANGPWLVDLCVSDTREWPTEEVEPGRWASVNHELRMLGTTSNSSTAASSVGMRREEPVLRRMRQRYDERYPAPPEAEENIGGPGL